MQGWVIGLMKWRVRDWKTQRWMKDAARWWRIGQNGWRGKWNQPIPVSQMSSSWEKQQIGIWRNKLPMIIVPQHRLHLGMESHEEVSRISDLWTWKPVLYLLAHGINAATIFELAQIWLNIELDIINYKLWWKPYNTKKDAQIIELIQNCYLPYTIDNFLSLNVTIMPMNPANQML